jgi:hypothetical protein
LINCFTRSLQNLTSRIVRVHVRITLGCLLQEAMETVELRLLDGVKGNFGVSDKEYIAVSTTKSPAYQNDPDHPVMPYIQSSIIDAMSKARDMGAKDAGDPKAAFRPESGAAFIRLCIG